MKEISFLYIDITNRIYYILRQSFLKHTSNLRICAIQTLWCYQHLCFISLFPHPKSQIALAKIKEKINNFGRATDI